MPKRQTESTAPRYNHDEAYETGRMPEPEAVNQADYVTFKPLLREACTSNDYEDQFN